MGEAQSCLQQNSPYALLLMASAIIEATTNRPNSPTDHPATSNPRELFFSFADSGIPAVEALALAIATLHPDDILALAVRRRLHLPRVTALAPWITAMGKVEITDVSITEDPLGDGENIVISWAWSTGAAATVIIYIDHNVGGVVKDAFVVNDGGPSFAATYASLDPGELRLTPLDGAVARARVEDAIARGDQLGWGFENDTWPACRTIVEWILRGLPPGGDLGRAGKWSAVDRDAIVRDFCVSRFAAVPGIHPDDVRLIVTRLVEAACEEGSGDPLRWSPVVVEVALMSWLVQLGVDVPSVERAPDVVAAFAAFAHDRRSIDPHLAEETFAAARRWAPVFREILVALRDGDDESMNVFSAPRSDEFDMADLVEELEDSLIHTVGGRAKYAELDDQPLREDDDWSLIRPADVVVTTLIAQRMEPWATEFYDSDVAYMARHVLFTIATLDPVALHRSDRYDAFAAGILWFVASNVMDEVPRSDRSNLGWRCHTQKELSSATGVPASLISARRATIDKSVTRVGIDWTRHLHYSYRREILRVRANIAEYRRDR